MPRRALRLIALVSVYRIPDAPKILYDILKERSTENDPYTNISHRKLPSWSQHLKFFDSRPYRRWYLIYAGFDPVGTCYISKRNEIGIVISRAHRGKGYGLDAVNQLTLKHKPLKAIPGKRAGKFLANINPFNTRSIRMFKRLGFKHMQNTYEFPE